MPKSTDVSPLSRGDFAAAAEILDVIASVDDKKALEKMLGLELPNSLTLMQLAERLRQAFIGCLIADTEDLARALTPVDASEKLVKHIFRMLLLNGDLARNTVKKYQELVLAVIRAARLDRLFDHIEPDALADAVELAMAKKSLSDDRAVKTKKEMINGLRRYFDERVAIRAIQRSPVDTAFPRKYKRRRPQVPPIFPLSQLK